MTATIYTKAEVDTLLAQRYTKAEIDAKIATLQNTDTQQAANLLALAKRVTTLEQESAPAPLFSSGFDGTTALAAPDNFYTVGCWQRLIGVDGVFSWPPNIWGGGLTGFHMIAGVPVDATTIGDYMVNQIQTVTGRNGNATRALYSELKQRGGGVTQDPLMIQPAGETGDLYIRYWIKLQPNVVALMNHPNPNWRVLFEWKTGTSGGSDDGDYRVIVSLVTWGLEGPLTWHIQGDNQASNPVLPMQVFWDKYTLVDAQTLSNWMKFEVFWHRSSGPDGRVWMAVNGQTIVDRLGPNKLVKPINRICITNVYTSTPYPAYQWLDDLEIRDGIPAA